MAITIRASVGYKGANNADDVAKLHQLLKGVPASKGGPPAGFDAARGYSSETDRHIYNFQLMHFGRKYADALVSPDRGTLAKLNALSAHSGVVPAKPPTVAPAPAAGSGAPRRLLVIMTNQMVGTGLVAGYHPSKDIPNAGTYKVPLYKMLLGTADGSSRAHDGPVHEFAAIRFAVSVKHDPPAVVGLAQRQEHILSWATYMGGSWNLYGNFLIHEGAGSPQTEAWGSFGCLEVTGPDGWSNFKKKVLELSFGADLATTVNPERAITAAKSFLCRVEAATRPALIRA
jgi:hypothetical protein